MPTASREIVSEVFCRVIQQVAFLFAEAVAPEALPPTPRPFLEASMAFDGDGPLHGRLTMALPRDACATIAANVLGLEPDDPSVAAAATDSLKELLNVTCGHILTALAGDGPVFNLSIPQVRDLDEAGRQALLACPATMAFLVEEDPALLRLELQEA